MCGSYCSLWHVAGGTKVAELSGTFDGASPTVLVAVCIARSKVTSDIYQDYLSYTLHSSILLKYITLHGAHTIDQHDDFFLPSHSSILLQLVITSPMSGIPVTSVSRKLSRSDWSLASVKSVTSAHSVTKGTLPGGGAAPCATRPVVVEERTSPDKPKV